VYFYPSNFRILRQDGLDKTVLQVDEVDVSLIDATTRRAPGPTCTVLKHYRLAGENIHRTCYFACNGDNVPARRVS